MTLLSVVLALALTAALAACGSDEPSGVTGPDRTASTPTETPASPTRTPSTPVSGDAPTATDAPRPTATTAPPAASGSDEPSGVTGPDRTASTPTETPASPTRTPSTPVSGDAPTATDAPRPTATTAPPAASGSAETDREALAALYNATGGAPSLSKWLSDAPLSEWDGVKTDDDGRVTELNLTGNQLSGEIPPELGSLSNLAQQRVERGEGCGSPATS